MNYLIGDLQGCCDALDRLLQRIDFSPSRDRLWLLGDLVNRGPASLATLRRLISLGNAATCLLGNHDLHLLATAHGVRRPHKGDTVDDILSAPDRAALIDWLRQQRARQPRRIPYPLVKHAFVAFCYAWAEQARRRGRRNAGSRDSSEYAQQRGVLFHHSFIAQFMQISTRSGDMHPARPHPSPITP